MTFRSIESWVQYPYRSTIDCLMVSNIPTLLKIRISPDAEGAEDLSLFQSEPLDINSERPAGRHHYMGGRNPSPGPSYGRMIYSMASNLGGEI